MSMENYVYNMIIGYYNFFIKLFIRWVEEISFFCLINILSHERFQFDKRES